MARDSVEIINPLDAHVHLRQGNMMEKVAPYTTSVFSCAVPMPNTDPPIRNEGDVSRYRRQISRYSSNRISFNPWMTFRILSDAPSASIPRCVGCLIGKWYPGGVTTGSGEWRENIVPPYSILASMEKRGLFFSIHAEMPDVSIFDSEVAYIPILDDIVQNFQKLKIVVEHISTKTMAMWVENAPPNVAATITAHHPFITWEDIFAPDRETFINPHNFSKPCANTVEDRDYLVQKMTSGNPKFFFGSDSAPHLRELKECAKPKAGVFSAPVALAILAEIFEKADALDKLQGFVSDFGLSFYGIKPKPKVIRLLKKPQVIPDVIAGIVPFMAGETLNWQIETAAE